MLRIAMNDNQLNAAKAKVGRFFKELSPVEITEEYYEEFRTAE
jgi:hypothetical protein